MSSMSIAFGGGTWSWTRCRSGSGVRWRSWAVRVRWPGASRIWILILIYEPERYLELSYDGVSLAFEGIDLAFISLEVVAAWIA